MRGDILAVVIAAAVGAWALTLALIDVRWRRLPDVLTLPATVLSLVLCWHPAGLLWPGLYLMLAVRGGGIGGGDIKLAISLGMLAAAAGGWVGVACAIVAANLLSLLVMAVAQRADAPHGPAMLVAALGVWLLCGT
ncbi:prepilin peptidase [Corynebacterium lizhenjunii]|uniref:Prepilin peptidase n=1 Tax=Corynebacterium lizhenjunii TaxID=2709394 RepID=A0A7T0KCW6_9CORY|nr:prepilin peptidase [Corynebacterium lizhenjunii]QPK78217.1 prepilin peptidase [Corynebacterium lizhenjunii]